MRNLSPKSLEDCLTRIFKASGIPEEKARIVAGNLVRSDLRGIRSHGVNHFGMYIEFARLGVIDLKGEARTIRESPCTALIDGNMNFGQIVCREAAELVVKKAKECGVATVSIVNCGHVGHLGDYTRMIVEKGMIGIMFVNTDKGVAPYGGKDTVLGTNPVSVAIPAGEEAPIIADFATSATAGGYILYRLRMSEEMPEGWAIDSSGNPTTKPEDLFKDTSPPVKWGDNFVGAILPAARHKGYALALIADVFAGALSGGRCNGDVIEGENGVFMQAINPEAFIPREEFEKRVDMLIRACRRSSPRPGFDKVRIPGDPEREAEKKAWKFGIPIDEELWEELVELGQKYGVDVGRIVKS